MHLMKHKYSISIYSYVRLRDALHKESGHTQGRKCKNPFNMDWPIFQTISKEAITLRGYLHFWPWIWVDSHVQRPFLQVKVLKIPTLTNKMENMILVWFERIAWRKPLFYYRFNTHCTKRGRFGTTIIIGKSITRNKIIYFWLWILGLTKGVTDDPLLSLLVYEKV